MPPKVAKRTPTTADGAAATANSDRRITTTTVVASRVREQTKRKRAEVTDMTENAEADEREEKPSTMKRRKRKNSNNTVTPTSIDKNNNVLSETSASKDEDTETQVSKLTMPVVKRTSIMSRLSPSSPHEQEASSMNSSSSLSKKRKLPELRLQLPTDVKEDDHTTSGDLDGDEEDHDESYLRMCQVTPPPSDRMLDHRNPPQPPRKVRKKRRLIRGLDPVTGRRTFPPLSPLLRTPRSSTDSASSLSPFLNLLETPPGSPRVFRSLEAEFVAVQDTPQRLVALHPPPINPRRTRTRRAATARGASPTIDTPTTTMVLRSRQLSQQLNTNWNVVNGRRRRDLRD